MSVELHVFCEDAKIPHLDAWQAAITRDGFPTILKPPFDLRRDTGFRPTTYNSKAAGFEFDLKNSSEMLSLYEHIRDQVGSRDQCATFRWGGDLMECASAMSSAAALTKLTDGIYFYADDDLLYSAESVTESIRAELASID